MGSDMRVGDEALLRRLYWATREITRISQEGAFGLGRDPFALSPVAHAYADGRISIGKFRECVRRWLGGTDFTNPENREWDQATEGFDPALARAHDVVEALDHWLYTQDAAERAVVEIATGIRRAERATRDATRLLWGALEHVINDGWCQACGESIHPEDEADGKWTAGHADDCWVPEAEGLCREAGHGDD